MKIYPAIDLLNGQCVRLKQGDFEQVTVYSNQEWKTPQELFRVFENCGFRSIHMVDLSGARNPKERQLDLIQNLVRSSKMKIQIGGGIRSISEVKALLDMGVERVVLGSIAVTQPQVTIDILKEFGPTRVTLALDVCFDSEASKVGTVSLENFKVATHGWREKQEASVQDVLTPYLECGVQRILCTDIGRDGMLQGPNFKLYQSLVEKFPGIEFQASGGVRSVDDFPILEATGVHSVVVGKALYEKLIGWEQLSTPTSTPASIIEGKALC